MRTASIVCFLPKNRKICPKLRKGTGKEQEVLVFRPKSLVC